MEEATEEEKEEAAQREAAAAEKVRAGRDTSMRSRHVARSSHTIINYTHNMHHKRMHHTTNTRAHHIQAPSTLKHHPHSSTTHSSTTQTHAHHTTHTPQQAKGNEAYKAKRFDEALAHYDAAIAKYDKDISFITNK
jgi:hypothetical protein